MNSATWMVAELLFAETSALDLPPDPQRAAPTVSDVPTTDPTHSALTGLHEIVHLARLNFVQGRPGMASDSVP
jgi:hypothetical protein